MEKGSGRRSENKAVKVALEKTTSAYQPASKGGSDIKI